MKKYLLIFLMVFIMAPVTSCTSIRRQENLNKKIFTVKVITKSSDNTFWNTIKSGTTEAGKEFGLNVIYDEPINEKDVDVQIEIIEESIEEKVDAIVLAATDYIKLEEVVNKAVEVGIPVIVIDSMVKSDKISSFIGTDNILAAKKVTTRMIDLIDSKGKVAIMNFVKGSATADEREEGVNDVLSKYPKIELVDTMYCLSDEKEAENLTYQLIESNSDLNGIIALNGPATTGVARAISKLGLKEKIKVVGFDNTEEEIDYLEDNSIQATVIQNPYNIGYLGIKTAYDILNKKDVERAQYTESTVIDKDNMYLPKNQKLLFPFIK